MSESKSYTYSLTIICFLFFCFGFITWVNGVLIPYFKICLELSNFQALFVMFASYTAYFFMALPSALVLRKTGYKKGMVLGLLIMALGTIMFVPAAYMRNYGMFLTGLFITGSGLALLQTAANPYVAVIGPIESTAQRVGFLGVSNKLAGVFSILVLGSIFLMGADQVTESIKQLDEAKKNELLDVYILKVITPYYIITLSLVALAVLIFFSKLPEIVEQEDTEKTSNKSNSLFDYPHLMFGVLGIFCTVGCEVLPVDGIILYGQSIGIPLQEALKFPTYSLFSMVVGYILSIILIPKYLSQEKALQFAALWGIMMIVGAYIFSGSISLYLLVGMAAGNAVLWGTIWGLALKNLGSFTKMGSAFLIMGIIGGAIIPPIFGKLIDVFPNQPSNALLLNIPLFIFLFYYGYKGHGVKRKETLLRIEQNRNNESLG